MWVRLILFQLEVLVLCTLRAMRRFWSEDDGASMVEYAILVALIAIVAIGAVQALGGGIAQVFQNILGRIQGLGR